MIVSPLTPWDRSLGARTFVTSLLLGALSFAVLRATDEATATTAARIARMCALVPALAALAVQVVAHRATASGDLLALACSGVPRARSLGAAVLVAAASGLCAALLLALGGGSLDGLFPPASGDPWVLRGDTFVGPLVSLQGPWGPATFTERAASPPATPRIAVAGSIALFSLALPLWSARAEGGFRRVLVGTLLLAASLFGFHAVAAGASAPALLVAPLALLGYLGLPSRFHGSANR